MLKRRELLFVILLTLLPTVTSARVYDEDHPLVYEDAWDLWPYSFVNDTGEPTGFNIDLLKLIFKELNIPYRIKLKPTQAALNDLKAGRADLMCGMDAHFHNEYAQYGSSVIQIFTHSIVHRKDEPVLIKSVDDLATQRVIVHEGSFSHHLMQEWGWGKNAIPYNDMQDAVQYVHNHKGSQIAWNTLSLKWLLHKFGYNDLELTPVNIPHGEYKFMSNDTRLLEQMDSVYTKLNSTGRLQPIQNKWFYPEHKDTGIPSWVWYVVAALLTVIIFFLIYYVFSRLYERKMTKNIRLSNNRLLLILNTGKVHIWLYDITTKMLTSINRDGKKTSIPLSPDFIHFYVLPEDFERLSILIGEIASRKKERETMEFHAAGQCAIIYTTLAMCEALKSGDDEMEGLANIPRRIEGVKIGITMREKAGGVFKISVRTNDGINAAEFCRQFGGGGHPAASGCSIEGDLGTVKKILVDAAEAYLQ